MGWWEKLTKECRLMDLDTPEGQVRITAEIFMEIGAVLYIVTALREAGFLGYKMFVENLVSSVNLKYLVEMEILFSKLGLIFH